MGAEIPALTEVGRRKAATRDWGGDREMLVKGDNGTSRYGYLLGPVTHRVTMLNIMCVSNIWGYVGILNGPHAQRGEISQVMGMLVTLGSLLCRACTHWDSTSCHVHVSVENFTEKLNLELATARAATDVVSSPFHMFSVSRSSDQPG